MRHSCKRCGGVISNGKDSHCIDCIQEFMFIGIIEEEE